jgi:hypothetical protein
MYIMPNGDRLVAPRVLVRTIVITRNVVALPDGYGVQEEAQDPSNAEEIDTDRSVLGDEQRQFWMEFLDGLKLDDPEQPMARPARLTSPFHSQRLPVGLRSIVSCSAGK